MKIAPCERYARQSRLRLPSLVLSMRALTQQHQVIYYTREPHQEATKREMPVPVEPFKVNLLVG